MQGSPVHCLPVEGTQPGFPKYLLLKGLFSFLESPSNSVTVDSDVGQDTFSEKQPEGTKLLL